MSHRRFTAKDARHFYDRFGVKQDRQSWYEDPALDVLITAAGFENSQSVLELGCGTGRLAARLLGDVLPESCRYVGLDLSPTMIGLAEQRIRPWSGRAEVELVDGRPPLPVADDSVDRAVSTYVFDLLGDEALDGYLGDIHRVLSRGGRLCHAGISPGAGIVTRVVSGGWSLIHRLDPRLVGGCRPIDLTPRLTAPRWKVLSSRKVAAYGITSEVVIAEAL